MSCIATPLWHWLLTYIFLFIHFPLLAAIIRAALFSVSLYDIYPVPLPLPSPFPRFSLIATSHMPPAPLPKSPYLTPHARFFFHCPISVFQLQNSVRIIIPVDHQLFILLNLHHIRRLFVILKIFRYDSILNQLPEWIMLGWQHIHALCMTFKIFSIRMVFPEKSFQLDHIPLADKEQYFILFQGTYFVLCIEFPCPNSLRYLLGIMEPYHICLSPVITPVFNINRLVACHLRPPFHCWLIVCFQHHIIITVI